MKKLIPLFIFITLLSILGACGKDGDPGAPGTNGLSITRIGIISGSTTDLCDNADLCLFYGGEVIHFSDGTIIFTPAYTHLIGTDVDTFSPTVVGAPGSSPWVRVSVLVTRDGSFGQLYVRYDRAADQFYVQHDTNRNKTLDIGTDEILLTPSVSWE